LLVVEGGLSYESVINFIKNTYTNNTATHTVEVEVEGGTHLGHHT